jgi:uncharacterized membrane protein YvbJ
VTTDEKQCPYCGELVKKQAIKCKHCKSDLNSDAVVEKLNVANNKNSKESSSENIIKWGKITWGFKITLILILLLFLIKGFKNIKDSGDIFGETNIDCNNSEVIKLAESVIKKGLDVGSVKIYGITTDEKESNYRSCFCLIDIPSLDVKGENGTFYVRRTDNKKGFTVSF